MKLCVPIPCFFGNLPFETAVKKTAALGYRYVEIYDWRQLDLPAAKKALEKGISEVVFDRGGYLYTGRVAEVASGARDAGLKL